MIAYKHILIKMLMKLTLTVVLSFLLLWIFYSWSASANQNSYVVTAYYSPLPGQEYYSMWSYQAEIILNGEWIAGASGREVFSGMLAAPSWYSFWTKIYLEWLWIGSVEDRGGAIVPAGQRGYSYDRIDVWMWYGDEGLRRALHWWKRTVPGYVANRDSSTSINYYNIPAPAWTVNGFRKQSYNTTYESQKIELWIFESSLEFWDSGSKVHELQSILIELGYLHDEQKTGKYDEETFEAIFTLQVNSQILSKQEDPGAGRYGPKTRAELKKVYDEHLTEILEKELFLKKYDTLVSESEDQADDYINSLQNPVLGDVSPEVRELQKTLALLWFFERSDTAIFWSVTESSILEYQINRKIIDAPDSSWAWVFGPKTREAMIGDLAIMYLQEFLENEEIKEGYEKYIQEEPE